MPLEDTEVPIQLRKFPPMAQLNLYVTFIESDDQSRLLRIYGSPSKVVLDAIGATISEHEVEFNRGLARLDLKQVTVGTSCCAKYTDNDKWYRARVTSVSASTVGTVPTASVYYVDYGNIDMDVPITNLRLPISSLKPIADQATRFLMANVACVASSWSDDAISFCDEQLCQETIWAIVMGHSNDGVPLIKVHQEQGGVPFNKILVHEGYGIGFDALSSHSEALQLPTPVNRAVIPAYRSPRVYRTNVEVPVCVTGVIDAAEFFVRPVEQEASVNLHPLASPDAWNQLDGCHSIEPGIACLIISSTGQVCRGQIQESDPATGICLVFLVDFGATMQDFAFKLRLCPDQYRAIPPQAIRCFFDDEQPGSSDTDSRLAFLNEFMASGRIGRCVFKRCIGDSTYNVTLTVDRPTPRPSYARLSQLPPGNYDVELISVPDPEVFFVKLAQYRSQRSTLDSMITEFMRLDSNLAAIRSEHAIVGTPCLVQCTESFRWYRAEIKGAVNNVDRIVSFVDTGATDVYGLNVLQVICPELVDFLPAQAISCTPHLIKPTLALRNKTRRVMSKMLTGKQFSIKVLFQDGQGHNVVEIIDRTVDPPIAVNLQLRFLKSDPLAIVKPPTVTSVEKVFITWYESASYFFGQMTKFPVETVSLMSEEISKRYDQLKSDEKLLLIEDGHLKAGQFCCAPFELAYYRAMVVDHPAPGHKVEVLFIDYGNGAKVDMCDVKQLDLDLAEYPAIGFGCSIAENYSFVMGDLAPLVKRTLLDNEVVVEITSTNERGHREVRFVECDENEAVLSKLKAYGLTLREDDARPRYSGISMPKVEAAFSCPANDQKPMSFYQNRRNGGQPQTNGYGRSHSRPASASSSHEEMPSNGPGNVDSSSRDAWSDRRSVPKLSVPDDAGFRSARFVPPRMQRLAEQTSRQTGSDQKVCNGGVEADTNGTDYCNDGHCSPRQMPKLTPMKLDNLTAAIVKVTYVVSPRDFHCQFTTLGGELCDMSDEMNRQYSQNHGRVGQQDDTLAAGSPCCCKFSGDGLWYRAVIVKELSNGTVTVRYVDYGNEDTKSRDEIEPLDVKFCSLPMMAVRCALRGIAVTAWTALQCSDFERRVLDVAFLAAFDGGTNTADGPLEVMLSPVTHPAELSINYKLMAEKLFAPGDANDKIYKAMLYDTFTNPFAGLTRVRYNYAEPVRVSWVVSFGLFFMQLDSTTPLLDELLTRCSNLASIAQRPSNFDSGTPCLAIYREGSYQAWCRAVIVRPCRSSVYVFFVDYGNIEYVTKTDVRDIDQELLDIPAQALPCCFGGVQPLDKVWPMPTGNGENVTKYFRTGSLQCQFLGRLGRLYAIDFLVDGSPVTPRLISDGVLAISTANVPIIPIDSKVGIDENLAATDEAAEADEADEAAEAEAAPAKEDNRISVVVSHVNSPIDFYVQKSADLDALACFLTEIYEACDAANETDGVFERGSVCAAQMADDDNWYRAEVLAANDGEGLSVLFFDYGNGTVVPVSQVRHLPDALRVVPKHAVHCRLAGLKPDSQLPAETIDCFTALTYEEDELFAEFIGAQDGDTVAVRLYDAAGVSIRTKLVVSDDCLESRPFLKAPKLIRIGARFEGYVTHIVSPADFYLQKDDDSAALNDIQESLALLGSEGTDETPIGGSDLAFTIGDAVAAKYALDDVWYRAVLLEPAESEDGEDGFLVRFVDFGNEDIVPWSSMRQLCDAHFQAHILAFRCALHGIALPADGVFPQEVLDRFAELVDDVKLLAEIVEREDDGRYLVSLLNMGIDLATALSESSEGVVLSVDVASLHALQSEDSVTSDIGRQQSATDREPDSQHEDERDIGGDDEAENDVFECERPVDVESVEQISPSLEENVACDEEKTPDVVPIVESLDPEIILKENVTITTVATSNESDVIEEEEYLEEKTPDVVPIVESLDPEIIWEGNVMITTVEASIESDVIEEEEYLEEKTPDVVPIAESLDPKIILEENVTITTVEASIESDVIEEEEEYIAGELPEVAQIAESVDQEILLAENESITERTSDVEVHDWEPPNRSDKLEALADESKENVLVEKDYATPPEVTETNKSDKTSIDNKADGSIDGRNDVLQTEDSKVETQSCTLVNDVLTVEEPWEVSSKVAGHEEVMDSDDKESWDDAQETAKVDEPKSDATWNESFALERSFDEEAYAEAESVDDVQAAGNELVSTNISDDDKVARDASVAFEIEEAVTADDHTDSPVVQ